MNDKAGIQIFPPPPHIHAHRLHLEQKTKRPQAAASQTAGNDGGQRKTMVGRTGMQTARTKGRQIDGLTLKQTLRDVINCQLKVHATGV